MTIQRALNCSSGHGEWLHLPAHVGGKGLPPGIRALLRRRAGVWDVPELPGFGGPLEPKGVVAESQQRAADSMNAERAWYGVNGATGLLQAALLAITRPGEAVLMPRNVHRSLVQACALGGIIPVLFDLPFLEDRGHSGVPNRDLLEQVIQISAAPLVQRPVAAVLVNPTYQGYAADLRQLIPLLHNRGLPVLVDEAHGFHFTCRIDDELPVSALHAGADMVVHSLHKSAAGLGQTAVLWLQGDRVDPDCVERSLTWFQTSSPSALLLASCEAALSMWQQPSGRSHLYRCLEDARALFNYLRHKGVPLLTTDDPLRLVLHTAAAGLNGLDADNWLIRRRIIAELPEPGTITFCLGIARRLGLAQRLENIWRQLLTSKVRRMGSLSFAEPPLPLVAQPDVACGHAWRAAAETLPLDQTVGRIVAEMVCPYPPGIQLLVPGERLDRARVRWLNDQRYLWLGQIADSVRVMAV